MRKKRILKLLYRSFDDDLSEEEIRLLEKELKVSEALRREKETIIANRKAIVEYPSRSFKPFFAERVIQRITSMPEKKNSAEVFYHTLKAVFWKTAIIGAVCLIALILFNIGVGQNLPSEEAFYISDLTYEEITQIPLF